MVLVFDPLDGDFGVDLLAELGLDVALDGRGGVGAALAGALEAQADGLPGDFDEFGVAAVGLEHFADGGEDGLDLFFHGAILLGVDTKTARGWRTVLDMSATST